MPARLITVVGARPQFVKAAAVSRSLAAHGIAESMVHTGQHFDDAMSRVFFEELQIPEPKVNLGLGGLSHGALTGRMIEALEALLAEVRPDAVLVYGDTNSTLAGALAAVKLHIPIAHVEAGLRSFNRRMPEEINRLLTDQVSEWLFAPTPTAVENLHREGVAPERVRLVGDVMYDATILFSRLAGERNSMTERLGLKPKGFVLATVHREENTDDRARLKAIVDALDLHALREDVVLPLHPRTRKRLDTFGIRPERVRLLDPIGYLDMLDLERNARVIATDSGGVQKEAYFLRVPCVTFRDETEWVELVHAGWNRLVPPHSAEILAKALADAAPGHQTITAYGDGDASERIAAELATAFSSRRSARPEQISQVAPTNS